MSAVFTDRYTLAQDIAVQAASVLLHHLDVTWSDGRVSPYHFVWLRDNCPCTQCVHPLTHEQLLQIADAPECVPAPEVHIDSGYLFLRWWDGHCSQYDASWLRAFAYDDSSRADRCRDAQNVRGVRRDRQLGTDPDRVPRFVFDDVIQGETRLREWAVAIQQWGLTQVVDIPRVSGQVETLALCIAPVRSTQFGTVFDVRCEPVPTSNAYIDIGLAPHTDLPTREAAPGLQLLHCLENTTTGGRSLFVDGFAMAEALRVESPADFELLCTCPLSYRTKSGGADYQFEQTIIRLGADGSVTDIRHANFLREPFDASPAVMMSLYRAYRKWCRMAQESRFQLLCRLAPGEAWCFDQRRYMHGREPFDAASGKRHLQGCYIDQDDFLSRLRTLLRTAPTGGE